MMVLIYHQPLSPEIPWPARPETSLSAVPYVVPTGRFFPGLSGPFYFPLEV
jgi:hypothetical protein